MMHTFYNVCKSDVKVCMAPDGSILLYKNIILSFIIYIIIIIIIIILLLLLLL